MRPRELILYGKPNCSLCDKAKAAVASAGLSPDIVLREVDIEQDEELFDLYRYDIPVLVLEGRQLVKGIVTTERLREQLRRVGEVAS
jgi:glutaredoxin